MFIYLKNNFRKKCQHYWFLSPPLTSASFCSHVMWASKALSGSLIVRCHVRSISHYIPFFHIHLLLEIIFYILPAGIYSSIPPRHTWIKNAQYAIVLGGLPALIHNNAHYFILTSTKSYQPISFLSNLCNNFCQIKKFISPLLLFSSPPPLPCFQKEQQFFHQDYFLISLPLYQNLSQKQIYSYFH